jgi:hypothetical protein
MDFAPLGTTYKKSPAVMVFLCLDDVAAEQCIQAAYRYPGKDEVCDASFRKAGWLPQLAKMFVCFFFLFS